VLEQDGDGTSGRTDRERPFPGSKVTGTFGLLLQLYGQDQAIIVDPYQVLNDPVPGAEDLRRGVWRATDLVDQGCRPPVERLDHREMPAVRRKTRRGQNGQLAKCLDRRIGRRLTKRSGKNEGRDPCGRAEKTPH